jgi:hypothetical protein
VNEAEEIKNNIPVGKAFLALDPTSLPFIFKQILTNALEEL